MRRMYESLPPQEDDDINGFEQSLSSMSPLLAHHFGERPPGTVSRRTSVQVTSAMQRSNSGQSVDSDVTTDEPQAMFGDSADST